MCQEKVGNENESVSYSTGSLLLSLYVQVQPIKLQAVVHMANILYIYDKIVLYIRTLCLF